MVNSQYPFGLDISKWQASQDGLKRVNFDTMMSGSNPPQFIAIRSGQGATYKDPQFTYNWAQAGEKALPRIAYHYFLPTQGYSQVRAFVDFVQPQAGELLVLDLENNGGLGKLKLTKMVLDTLDLIQELTGRHPLIYSRTEWLNANIDTNALPKLDYWLAQYRRPNLWPFFTAEFDSAFMDIPRGVTREQVKFHQSSERGNGKTYGAQSYYIDTDRFLGTQDELISHFGGASETLPVPEPEPEPESEIKPLFQAKVIADVLIVRDAPQGNNTGSRYYEGDIVDVYAISGDWYKLGELRWVSALWVTRLDTVPPIDLNLLNVPAMSQNNPRWSSIKLGTSTVTIGQQGCLLTCAAMISKFYGYDTDPARLNAALLKVGGYYMGNQFVWGALSKIYPLEVADWIDCFYTPAPLHLLDAALKRGSPCIVWVDFNISTANVDMHWIVVVGKLGTDDYTMVDPWTGKQGSFKSEYGSPSRYIFRIVSYKRK